MPLVYRPAREQDLERAQELVVGSINDLTERHGFGPMAVLRPTRFQSFSLKDDPDGLWLAEDAGEILGFALSWICGDLWFLAELFVSPGHQGRGIGRELLKRTLDHAQKSGAPKYCPDHLHVQRGIARTLYSTRNVSSASNLQFQCQAGSLDGSAEGRTIA